MHAIISQLYMIPSIRKDILSIHNDHFEQLPNKTNLISQLKEIFQAYDKEIKSTSLELKEFCKAFNEYKSSSCLYPQAQIDAVNFFLEIISYIDQDFHTLGLLLNTIERHFKGIFENKITSKLCSLEKMIFEDFIVIPVSIENLKTLDESLNKFFKGEILIPSDDYHCEQCHVAHEVLLERSLRKLPNYLVFEMKRAILDFEIFDFSLIHSYHELPDTLNLQLYIKNDHSDPEKEEKKCSDNHEDYKYRLSGLVIYQVTQTSGKYYSFIRDREVLDQWYMVDRNEIKKFDHDNISKLAFGNKEKEKKDGSWAHLVIYDQIQTNSLNIYEKEP